MSAPRVGKRLRTQILADAGGRCGYCKSSEEITGAPLEVEHQIPIARGGQTRRSNLWAACRQCNVLKSDRVAGTDPVTEQPAILFNPRLQIWMEHFSWVEAGTRIVGLTAIGRATVAALALNRPLLRQARQRWIAAGWHPPADPNP